MKVKDLAEDTNLINFKLKVPAKVLKKLKAYAGGEKEMYVVGCVMGYGFMMPFMDHGVALHHQ